MTNSQGRYKRSTAAQLLFYPQHTIIHLLFVIYFFLIIIHLFSIFFSFFQSSIHLSAGPVAAAHQPGSLQLRAPFVPELLHSSCTGAVGCACARRRQQERCSFDSGSGRGSWCQNRRTEQRTTGCEAAAGNESEHCPETGDKNQLILFYSYSCEKRENPVHVCFNR